MKTKARIRYCARDFTPDGLEIMRRIIAEDPDRTRAQISRIDCKAFGWYKPDGGLKEMSCRVAMLRMHKDGLLTLPPPRHQKNKPRTCIEFTESTAPKPQVSLPVGALPDLHIELITDKSQSALWNEYIHRYHYLGTPHCLEPNYDT